MITRCGLDCRDCYAYPNDCPGCKVVAGKPAWAESIGEEQCQLYQCSAAKAYAHCGQCNELPCKMWYDLKDPSLSDEGHLQAINERIERLRSLQ